MTGSTRLGRTLTTRGRGSGLATLLLLSASTLAGACGDDGSDPSGDTGGSGAGGGGSGGSDAATGGGGSGGEPGGGGSGGEWSGSCDPESEDPLVPDPGDDECLQCLAAQCCSEVFQCGGIYQPEDDAGAAFPRYPCYDLFFDCTRMCFNREVATNSSTDSDELLVECGRECFPDYIPNQELDYGGRDFLACAAGQPRPIVTSTSGTFVEGAADADAGTPPNCLAECLPAWR